MGTKNHCRPCPSTKNLKKAAEISAALLFAQNLYAETCFQTRLIWRMMVESLIWVSAASRKALLKITESN